MGLVQTLLLGLGVLVGSAVPFVPTGEAVSAAAAFVSGSLDHVLLVFGVVLVASVLGDSAMLLGVRLASRLLRPAQKAWLARRRLAPAVLTARRAISAHASQAVLTGRLVPGGRAPVIIALGLSRYPVGRFVLADLVACAAWASIYVALGTLGGRVSGHPLLGTALAVVCAVGLGLLVGRVERARSRHGANTPA